MKKIKIIVPVLLIFALFAISLILQSKYSNIISDNSDIYATKNLFLEEITFANTSIPLANVLIGCISLAIAIVIVILIFMLFNRRRMEKREELKGTLLEMYQKLIFDTLESDEINKREIRDFKKILNTRFKRNILIDQIVDVGKMLPAEVLTKLRELYRLLGLLEDTRRKINSRRWDLKIKGLKELSHLGIKQYNSTIMKLINSKNKHVRMEAQIALVKLSDSDTPFDFLEHLTQKFTKWEQITLHELMNEGNMEVPYFGKWLYSDNHSVGEFCLRMMREYEQLKNVEDLDRMLYHPNEKIARLAVEVAGDLKVDPVVPSLKKLYKDESYETQIEIVKTLGKIKNPKTIRFLQNVIDVEEDTQLQIEGVKAINAMGEVGDTQLKKMMNSDYKNYNIIIKHVLDDKIN
jgi:HEAT repeat protein